MRGEFDWLAGIIDNGSGGPPDCDGLFNLTSYVVDSTCLNNSVEATLSAGTFWVFAAPSAFTGVVCGAPYTLTVTCPIFEDGFEALGTCYWSDTNPSVVCP